MVSGRRLGHMPLTKSKNQYTKTRNRLGGEGDVAKDFFINNGDVASVINSVSLVGKMDAKWFDYSSQVIAEKD